MRCCQVGLSEDPDADRRKSVDFGWRALEAGGDDPATLVNAAHALSYFGEDIGAMIALVDRALTLNPSFARGWHVSGLLRLRAGQPDVAIERLVVTLPAASRARTFAGAAGKKASGAIPQ
jgi:adenylate cyclase